MSLMNLEVVDVISIDLNGNAVFTISDDQIWDDKNEHLLALQNKINSYLGFIESGNVYQEYPDAKGRNVVIEVVAKYEPNNNAKLFLDRVTEILQSAGYAFSFRVLKNE
jgi:hypothetical protein